jgi:hypothetical protein
MPDYILERINTTTTPHTRDVVVVRDGTQTHINRLRQEWEGVNTSPGQIVQLWTGRLNDGFLSRLVLEWRLGGTTPTRRADNLVAYMPAGRTGVWVRRWRIVQTSINELTITHDCRWFGLNAAPQTDLPNGIGYRCRYCHATILHRSLRSALINGRWTQRAEY